MFLKAKFSVYTFVKITQLTKSFLLFLFLMSSLLWTSVSHGQSRFQLMPGQTAIAVGDIHGDLNALKEILISAQLIDSKDNWIGGQNHLVLVGDLIDRGPQSKEVMDFVMALENKARLAGGHVHALLGNHELGLVKGRFRYLHPNDLSAYDEFAKWYDNFSRDGQRAKLLRAFRDKKSPYAQWIKNRKTQLIIGNTLFEHAGFSPAWKEHARKYSIDEVNAMVSDWIRYYQGELKTEPAVETEFVIANDGPLFSRSFGAVFLWNTHVTDPTSLEANNDRMNSNNNNIDLEKIKKMMISKADVKDMLGIYNVDRIVVGHTRIPNESYLRTHPIYGNMVSMIDSSISIAYNGAVYSRLSFISIDHTGQLTAHNFNRGQSHTQRRTYVEKIFDLKDSHQKSACSGLYR